MKKNVMPIAVGLIGAIVGMYAIKKEEKKFYKMRELSERHLALFLLMNQWVRKRQEGKNLESFFEEYGYKRIAVYGMSYVGETLIEELKETSVQIVYGIDRRRDAIIADIDVLTMEDPMDKVDAVVVTAITFFDEIEEILSEKMDCPIISLEDIIDEI